MSSESPDETKPITPKVLILWADCWEYAMALKAHLENHFKERAVFLTILDKQNETDDLKYEEKSKSAIAQADRFLVLAREDTWNTGSTFHCFNEVNLVIRRIQAGDLPDSALCFVKYNKHKVPVYFCGRHPLPFENLKLLALNELEEYERWLFQDTKLPSLTTTKITSREDFDFFLLNWLLSFDKTIWTPPDEPNLVKTRGEILKKLGLLKHLHSVHAKPGPSIDILTKAFCAEARSLIRRGDFREIKRKFYSKLEKSGGKNDFDEIFSNVQSLTKLGLLPLLEGLQIRIAENRKASPETTDLACGFLSDLLIRLQIICDSDSVVATQPSLNKSWDDGLFAATGLIRDEKIGLFLSAEDSKMWKEDHGNYYYILLSNVKELYITSIYLAVAVVLLFSYIQLQSPTYEDEAHIGNENDDANLQIIFRTAADIFRRNPLITDDVVKCSNNLILNYISAAEKLSEKV